MSRKLVLAMTLTFVLIGMLGVSLKVQRAEAGGTIYINSDGSINPSDAPISSINNVTYTFSDNINEPIVVYRDNIVVDGANYTLQGTEAPLSRGIELTGRSNITIKNMKIKAFAYGIYLYESSNNTIYGNNITANRDYGILLSYSSNNMISGSNITANNGHGIGLSSSSEHNSIFGNEITENDYRGIWLTSSSNYNSISENNVTANGDYGIWLYYSSNNTISGNYVIANKNSGIRLTSSSNYNSISENNIGNNNCGIKLAESSNNIIYHNNFINNTQQVLISTFGDANFWDNGVEGNYWSDYEERYPNATEIGNSGIWNTPYEIDESNQDNYPIVPEFPTWTSMLLILIVLTVATAIYKPRLLKTPTHARA